MKIKPVIVLDLEYRLSKASVELIEAMRSGSNEAAATVNIAQKWDVTTVSLREEATARLKWCKRITAVETPKEQE